MSTFCWAGSRRSQIGPEIMQQNIHIWLKSQQDITNMLKKSCDKTSTFRSTTSRISQMGPKIMWHPNFASGKGGHDVTEHFEEGGCHVTCEKPSTSKPGWTKNTWAECTSVRMSQGQIVTSDGLLGGWIVWVELSLGWFVGGWIVKAPPALWGLAGSPLSLRRSDPSV
jgi:hypothetical protein